MRTRHQFLLASATVLAIGAGSAAADEIKNPTAVFAGLDKITGRVITFDVAINETVQFGLLQIRPRVCYTRPQTEAPQTVSFLQVDEIPADKKRKRIFSGWMFAASPGLNGIEHPVYDVWLLNCKGGRQVIPSPPDVAAAPPPEAPAARPAAESVSARQGFVPNPPSPAPALRGAAGSSVAPAFSGAPIEVGAAPGAGPVAAPPRGEDDPDARPPPRDDDPDADRPRERDPDADRQPQEEDPSDVSPPGPLPPGLVPGPDQPTDRDPD